MEIMIKNAELKDLEDLQKLNLMLFEKEKNEYDQTFNLEWTFGEIGTKYFSNSINSKNACTLVAIFENSVVGYLIGWIRTKQNPCRNLNKQAEIENMFILDEFRNKNIGSRLIERFIKWSKKNNVDNICVTTSILNKKAINFYQSQGFSGYTQTLEINL